MKRRAGITNEIEISTKGPDGGQAIPVRVIAAVDLKIMFAGADALADRDADSTATSRADINPRNSWKAAQR